MTTIKQILQSELATEKADLKSHETLKALLTPFDGKNFDKRLENKIPGYKIKWEAATLIYIQTPGGRKHFMGWSNNSDTNRVNIARFDEIDSAYCKGAQDRIALLEGVLNNPEKLKQYNSLFMKMHKAFNSFKNAVSDIHSANMHSFHNPAYYSLLKNFGLPYRWINDIHYNTIPMD